MFKCFNKECGLLLLAGAVTGAAVTKFLKSKKAHDIAVKSVAQGIILKDSVMENISNIKEEADDICNEAKQSARGTCDCDCDCTAEEE